MSTDFHTRDSLQIAMSARGLPCAPRVLFESGLIVFQSGRRYRYLDVHLETATGLRAAFAKGEFFNIHIRGRFDYEEEPSDPA